MININQQNELTDNRDLSELKSNTINNNEPKKSKGFCVKQFSFEDFVLNKNGNLNDHWIYPYFIYCSCYYIIM